MTPFSIKRLFRRPKPIRIAPVLREANSLRLGEWRSTDSLVAEAQTLFRNNTFLAILQVLRNEHPVHYVRAESAERALGIIEGYQLCLNGLESFPVPIAPQQPVEATFEPPEE